MQHFYMDYIGGIVKEYVRMYHNIKQKLIRLIREHGYFKILNVL